LAIRRLAIGEARLNRVRIRDLEVERLTVGNLLVRQ
jgi:hypothetical protein